VGLSGVQREQLCDALAAAFPTPAALEQMVSFGLEKNLATITSESNLDTVVFELIKWAEAQDRVEQLVQASRKRNSGNVKLRAFADAFLPSSDLSSSNPAVAPANDLELYLSEEERVYVEAVYKYKGQIDRYWRSITRNRQTGANVPQDVEKLKTQQIAQTSLQQCVSSLEKLNIPETLNIVKGSWGEALRVYRNLAFDKYSPTMYDKWKSQGDDFMQDVIDQVGDLVEQRKARKTL